MKPGEFKVNSFPRLALAASGAAGWGISWVLLLSRSHLVLNYKVLESTGNLNPAHYALIVSAAFVLGTVAYHAAAIKAGQSALLLLNLSWILPLIECARQVGIKVPLTHLEPLFLALINGLLVAPLLEIVKPFIMNRGRARYASFPPYFLIVVGGGCAIFWFYQGLEALSVYYLGYSDFGLFARAMINTWRGNGFLRIIPDEPLSFYHFNPGLLLFVPVLGIWPAGYPIIVMQAVSLTLPAFLVYRLAQSFGASRSGAVIWAFAYLTYPVVGQMNLNFTYGWHPISIAIPLLFAALAALMSGRKLLALFCAGWACLYQEDVFLLCAWLGFAMAIKIQVSHWKGLKIRWSEDPLSARLSLRGWLVLGMAALVGFVVVTQTYGECGVTQRNRILGQFGSNPVAILLSPILNPMLFWPQLCKSDSLLFLLTLGIPLGFSRLAKGCIFLLPIIIPTTILLIWDSQPATCIAFQYSATLLPFLFLAALYGTSRMAPLLDGINRLSSGGLAVLMSCLTLSTMVGSLPWSQPSTPYGLMLRDSRVLMNSRAMILDEAVATAGDGAIVASGRIASHLLHARHLEVVVQTLRLYEAQQQLSPPKNHLAEFDAVIIDLKDFFDQTLAQNREIVRLAEAAGFQLLFAGDGILVYRRPGQNSPSVAMPLELWRVDRDDFMKIRHSPKWVKIEPGIRYYLHLTGKREFDGTTMRLHYEMIWQTTIDFPPSYQCQHIIKNSAGEVVVSTAPQHLNGGNRPTSICRQGELWRLVYSIDVPGDYREEELIDDVVWWRLD